MSISLSARAAPTATEQPVSFFTMNLHCQFDDWRGRLQQISQFIVSAQPVTVFFQEVCDGDGASMTTEIPKILAQAGYPIGSSRSLYSHDSWGGKYRESIFVATVWPRVNWIGGELPGLGLRRVYLGFQVGGFNFVNIHFENGNDAASAQDRADEVLAIVRAAGDPERTRTLIMGDFNSGPRDPEQALFFRAGYEPFFVGPSHPLPPPMVREIDGVWISPALREQLQNPHAFRVLDQPINGSYLSDHAAVLFTANAVGIRRRN